MTASAPDQQPSGQNIPDPQTPELTVQVCVIGAGPVGATLACRLAAAGIDTAILDHAPLPPMEHPDFDGRAYAIAAGSMKLLLDAGVWPLLPHRPCPIDSILITDGRPGQPPSPLSLEFGPQDSTEPFGWMVEARALRVALNRALHNSPHIRLFAPATADITRSDDHTLIITSTGQRIRAALVVAADGRQSRTRSKAGIPVTRLPYGQSGIVCAIAHEHPHDNSALEHFLPGGPFAQLPMSGTDEHPNLSAIVWSEKDAVAKRLFSLPDDTFTREIHRRMGDRLGRITPVGRRWTYPLSAQYAQSYTAPRLALIGDAAHGIHPIAGQGLNLGFRDVISLSTLLISAAEKGQDPGNSTLLTQYQRDCRPRNMMMFAATDALDRLFSNDNPVLRLARDIGIAGVGRMPRLRRAFVRHAMGV
ncbi:UbiH/UbiF/VisC/COQ6 family ubiquinone biosynthesis hydroxylase [Acetobacter sp. AN02]|uniref:UbiH/UbiF/VisC/COQ6 family ubiquinone biosynthesis hydroxylase n=1 Tax=Acetobacter sp. AN02 TaxID=2894186 RepID=UPI0024344056|nr:UbiH/UbiF/VisC/COQ6 family ubiquinone biosynthesis hydroxylase [Acetobacter sp. AN02]MDG6094052.1 UbiH/UbiF/VisC/COQ6 family ubiquinone biosynthesis hydroxylase [Acetobacter sp. AN02]